MATLKSDPKCRGEVVWQEIRYSVVIRALFRVLFGYFSYFSHTQVTKVHKVHKVNKVPLKYLKTAPNHNRVPKFLPK